MSQRNPYLILGVDFGASGDDARRAFAKAARRTRRQGGAWAVEDLTWALHEIEELEENPADLVDVYRVPADPTAFEPGDGTGIYKPAPVTIGRESAAPTADAVAAVRLAAITEYDDLIVGLLGALAVARVHAYEYDEVSS